MMKRREFLAGAAALLPMPGAQLPLGLPFTDSAGRAVRLGDYFEPRRAVLLVPGYWQCPQLCGLVMQSLLKALHDGGAARADMRIVGFSIDPADTPASARARRASDLAFADFLSQGRPAPQALSLELLVDPADSSARLASAMGVRYAPSPKGWEHPAVVVAATPEGRVSQVLAGLGFEPGELRIALAQARGGVVGAIGERIALFCSHLEPQAGRHTGTVLAATRAAGLAAAAGLGAWCWRRRNGANHER